MAFDTLVIVGGVHIHQRLRATSARAVRQYLLKQFPDAIYAEAILAVEVSYEAVAA